LTLAKKINRIQRFFVDSTRLGIPIIPFDEALHGLVRDGATVFPQAIGLAATWDSTLMNKVATAIAKETQQRGIRQILSPVVNLASDVRWGRTEETYGEDPVLSAAMGIAFVRAFEERGIITTPKHFVANVGDGGRDSYPVHINERLLEELYFPPFKKAIELGGSRSVMTAYNSLNGTAASSNYWLLTEKLKKQWGFRGFVISDANAVGGEVVLHNTAKDYPASGLHAINAGLDVIFQTEYKHHQLFIPPFLDGSIDSNRINDAVSRVLKAKFELGLFENPYVEESINPLPEHALLAKQAALKSIVLLKNDKNTLPFSSAIKRIAVIGSDAEEARLGGYSGPGNKVVSILKGLQKLKGKNNIFYHPGVGRKSEEYLVIPESQLIAEGKNGLQAAYYNNVSLTGKPFLSRQDPQIDFHWTLFG
ncbi:MAG TPA: glycoside hydrolase family 3 protein, partial [Chitinophagaceae bacterium]|nr:glycoside hydrolase family 3 protein [Chitinophagaceae bacterium]